MPLYVSGVGNTLPIGTTGPKLPAGSESTESFQQMLTDAVGSLGKLQAEADSSAAKLAAGEPVELHEVMLATEKANLAFELAVQVRNKVVEAYQEVMRMQI